MFLLQPRSEAKEVLQLSPGDDDVLVQLREACVTQGVGKLAPNLPDLFTGVSAQPAFHKPRALLAEDGFDHAQFRADRGLLAIEFENQVRAAAAEARTFGALK